MPRTGGSPANVAGSGHDVHIIDDLGSAVVQELVEQLNQSEIVVSATLTAAAGATARAVLGRWRQSMWIKEISVCNPQTDDFVAATTDIFAKHVAPTNADLVGAPTSPTTVFGLEGFASDTFAGPNALWDDEFIAGTNVTVKTGGSKAVVPAGNVFYAEFINNEAGQRTVEFTIIVSSLDKITLEPHGMNNPFHQRNREFRRANRQS